MPKKSGKNERELVERGKDKRFVRRDDQGRFDEVADLGKSITQDRKQSAKRKVPSGQGDRGDQERQS